MIVTNYIVTKETPVINILREMSTTRGNFKVFIDGRATEICGWEEIGIDTAIADVRIKEENICLSNFGIKTKEELLSKALDISHLVEKIDELYNDENNTIKIEAYLSGGIFDDGIERLALSNDIVSVLISEDRKVILLKDR